jgi:hypothetical protein
MQNDFLLPWARARAKRRGSARGCSASRRVERIVDGKRRSSTVWAWLAWFGWQSRDRAGHGTAKLDGVSARRGSEDKDHEEEERGELVKGEGAPADTIYRERGREGESGWEMANHQWRRFSFHWLEMERGGRGEEKWKRRRFSVRKTEWPRWQPGARDRGCGRARLHEEDE